MPLPISPLRRLGQHFLVDPNTAGRIVESLRAPAGASVVEIGAGTGALTGLLLARYPKLVALEVDARAVRYLEALYPRLDVRQCDVLEVDWRRMAAECGSPLHLIGNLPYNITSPIVFGLLRRRQRIAQAVFMMQREVAERLVAPPGTKAYGVPSVLAQLYARPELLFRVPRSVFRPRPGVESAVVRLDFDAAAEPALEYSRLRAVVRAAFGQRRKMLRNSLRPLAHDRGAELPERWRRIRAEDLSPAGFVELAQYLHSTSGGSAEIAAPGSA